MVVHRWEYHDDPSRQFSCCVTEKNFMSNFEYVDYLYLDFNQSPLGIENNLNYYVPPLLCRPAQQKPVCSRGKAAFVLCKQ